MLRNLNQSFGGKRLMFRTATGVRGDQVPQGEPSAAGPAWMFRSIQRPLDDAAEFRLWVLDHTFPDGVLPPDDYGSLGVASLPDGVYTASVELRRFDVNLGAFAVVLIVGPAPGYSDPRRSAEFLRPSARIGSRPGTGLEVIA